MAIIGTLIEGKYEILKLIGKGGMSEVYLAMDKNLNKQWAVKEIKKRARDKNNEVVVQSAIAEANMMKKLDHPCLPRIVDIIDKEDVIYVVMDYIEEKSATDEEKIEIYLEAVDIKPTDTKAYLGLIAAFKDDAVFTVEEENEFKKKINNNLSGLREQDDYADLAYEIGRLYWYYYDYGKTDTSDNQITRIKSSVQWFSDAYDYGSEESDYHLITQVYKEIGQFTRDVTLNVEEASDKGTYAPYFQNLEDLLEIVDGEDSEIVNLEVYKLCLNSIENYARKFKSDGIEESRIQAFYQDVLDRTDAVDTTTDKTDEIKQQILERKDAAQDAIKNAYSEQ